MVYVLAMILRENKIEMPLAAKIANNIRYHLSSQKARYDCDFNFVSLSQCGMKGKTRKQIEKKKKKKTEEKIKK